MCGGSLVGVPGPFRVARDELHPILFEGVSTNTGSRAYIVIDARNLLVY